MHAQREPQGCNGSLEEKLGTHGTNISVDLAPGGDSRTRTVTATDHRRLWPPATPFCHRGVRGSTRYPRLKFHLHFCLKGKTDEVDLERASQCLEGVRMTIGTLARGEISEMNAMSTMRETRELHKPTGVREGRLSCRGRDGSVWGSDGSVGSPLCPLHIMPERQSLLDQYASYSITEKYAVPGYCIVNRRRN